MSVGGTAADRAADTNARQAMNRNSLAPITAEDFFAIGALMAEFYCFLDRGGSIDAESLAARFSSDASIITPKFEVRGRTAIQEWLAARALPSERLTRHSFSNLRLTPLDERTLTAHAHLMTVAGLGAPPIVSAEITVGETNDVMTKSPSGSWLFAERRMRVLFEARMTRPEG
jgi:hypothetical protein